MECCACALLCTNTGLIRSCCHCNHGSALQTVRQCTKSTWAEACDGPTAHGGDGTCPRAFFFRRTVDSPNSKNVQGPLLHLCFGRLDCWASEWLLRHPSPAPITAALRLSLSPPPNAAPPTLPLLTWGLVHLPAARPTGMLMVPPVATHLPLALALVPVTALADRLRSPALSYPCSLVSFHGWDSLDSIRPHINSHLAGQLEGDFPVAWLSTCRFGVCMVCSWVLSTRWSSMHPSCRSASSLHKTLLWDKRRHNGGPRPVRASHFAAHSKNCWVPRPCPNLSTLPSVTSASTLIPEPAGWNKVLLSALRSAVSFPANPVDRAAPPHRDSLLFIARRISCTSH